jgi:hypothetical protein
LFRRGRSAEARDALPPLAEAEQQQRERERPEEGDEAALLQEMQRELRRLAAENHRMRDETKKYLRETDQREADCECACLMRGRRLRADRDIRRVGGRLWADTSDVLV